jgi:mannosyltransferase OCH1-like enzyme
VIPRRLIRTVPEDTSHQQEQCWRTATDLHPDWDHVTYRDPIDPAVFPRTSPHWSLCQNGAQLAGLVRLEALWWQGGCYLDSDVEIVASLEPLTACDAFAAWEDDKVIPDAVIGAAPRHPAIDACLNLALERLHSDDTDWRTGRGAWSTGPGVTTNVFPGRADVLVLPPGSFYPVHYAPRETLERRLATYKPEPWVFGIHRWDWSWRP